MVSLLRQFGFRLVIYPILCAVLVSSGSHVSAQDVSRSNVAVSIYNAPADGQPPDKAALGAFAPAAPNLVKFADLAPDAIMDISPDGKRIIVTGGDSQDQDQLSYGLIGQKMTLVPVEKDHRVLWAAFSPNGRYLTYTTASLDNDNGAWLLGLVEIASGKKVEFTGNFNESGQQNFSGVGDGVGWSADGKHLYLRTYMPFSANGGYDNLYNLDLSADDFDKPGRYPMPAAVRLLQPNEQMVNFAFSDDGSKLAVMLFDSSNPAQGIQGSDTPPNVLSVREMATGNELYTYRSDKGQALEFPLAWTLEGQKLLFAGGFFKDSSFIVTPTLYTADIATRQTISLPLIDDASFDLESVIACSGTFYFVAARDNPSDGTHTAILYSAPLSDLKTRTRLATSSYISLLSCVPSA